MFGHGRLWTSEGAKETRSRQSKRGEETDVLCGQSQMASCANTLSLCTGSASIHDKVLKVLMVPKAAPEVFPVLRYKTGPLHIIDLRHRKGQFLKSLRTGHLNDAGSHTLLATALLRGPIPPREQKLSKRAHSSRRLWVRYCLVNAKGDSSSYYPRQFPIGKR